MRALFKPSGVFDAIKEKLGLLVNWTVLPACLISVGDAAVRKVFDTALDVRVLSCVVRRSLNPISMDDDRIGCASIG